MKVKKIFFLLLISIFLLPQTIVFATETEPEPEFSIEVFTDKETYDVDEEILYEIKLSNLTNRHATDVQVTATMPEELEIVQSGAEIIENELQWDVDALTAFEHMSVEFTAKLKDSYLAANPSNEDDQTSDPGTIGGTVDQNDNDDQSSGANAGVIGEADDQNLIPPRTGDDTSILIYFIILGISIISLIVALRLLKKKQVSKGATLLLILLLVIPPFNLAEANSKNMVEETYGVTIGEKEYEVSVTVGYLIDLADNDSEIDLSGNWFYEESTDTLSWALNWDFNQEDASNELTYQVYSGITDDINTYELISETNMDTYLDEDFNQFGNTYYFVKVLAGDEELAQSDVVIADVGVDSDGDDLTDALEAVHGTDPLNSDTDGDGLPDGYEVYSVGTDPLLRDSDGNGVEDGDEDTDHDGLTNIIEFNLGTNPLAADSDGDGLEDGEEVHVYHTDPLNPDTDGDGVEDGFELEHSFDPLNPDTNGNGILDGDEELTYTTEIDESNKDEHLSPSVEITSKASEAARTSINNIEGENWFLNEEIPGYIGAPFDFNAVADFDEAIMTFEYDTSLNSEDFEPALFYFNEEEQRLEKVENQTLYKEEGKVEGVVDHFSVYTLLNSIEWDEAWEQNIRPPQLEEDGGFKNIDVVFSIDSSGSMGWNDPNDIRKTASKAFVDKLEEEDRAAVVDFDTRADVLIELTTDKAEVKYAIDMINSSGGTNLYRGVMEAVDEFVRNGNEDNIRYMIFLTDGDGTWRDSAIDYANEHGVTIYTIGLGSSVRKSLLERIANETGGKYFFADEAFELEDLFGGIAEDTIDFVKDSDEDGIPDWYEINGMRLGNGISIKTDPYNPDSDYDGLPDGEEIVPENFVGDWEEGIYFKMHSHPLLEDTDGDGLGDAIEPLERRDHFDITNRHTLTMSDISYLDLAKHVGTNVSRINLNANDQTEYEGREIPIDAFEELKRFRLYDSYVNEVTGFYGLAFKRGNQIAIIYRGTDSGGDWVRNLNIRNNTHPQVASARDFAAQVLINNPNAEITIAGHSLGGFLTQAVAYNMKEGNFEQAELCFNAAVINDIITDNSPLQRGVTFNSAHFINHNWIKDNDKYEDIGVIPYEFLFGNDNGVVPASAYDHIIANFAMDKDPLNLLEGVNNGTRLGSKYVFTRNDDEPGYGFASFGAHSLVYFYSKTNEMNAQTGY